MIFKLFVTPENKINYIRDMYIVCSENTKVTFGIAFKCQAI